MNRYLYVTLFRVIPVVLVVGGSFFLGEYVEKSQKVATPAAQTTKKVSALNPNLAVVEGTIKNKSGNNFQIVYANGGSGFIGVTSATTLSQTVPRTAADLAIGDKVLVTGGYLNQADIRASQISILTAK